MNTFTPEMLTRQLELIPDEALAKSITIVGAGAVGSFTALALAKMGYHNLDVYDFDVVDTENMNCQFFRISDIGKPKVEALQDLIQDFIGVEIQINNKRIEPTDTIMGDIIITAVDKIEVRRHLFELGACNYLIDPRMGAEYASMQVVDMFDSNAKDNYAKSLYASDEVVHERCTAKATMYTVNLLAGQVAKAVKDVTTGNKYIKTLEWNINSNSLMAFDSNGSRL